MQSSNHEIQHSTELTSFDFFKNNRWLNLGLNTKRFFKKYGELVKQLMVVRWINFFKKCYTVLRRSSIRFFFYEADDTCSLRRYAKETNQ